MIKLPVKILGAPALAWFGLANDDKFIASHLSSDDAADIARILNAHDALVAALENLLAVRRGEGGTLPNADGLAEEALKLAKGE